MHPERRPINWTRIRNASELVSPDTGAVVVYATENARHDEARLDAPGADHRSLLMERQIKGRTMIAAVFARVPPGTYMLTARHAGWEEAVEVTAGRVHQVDWRGRQRVARPSWWRPVTEVGVAGC